MKKAFLGVFAALLLFAFSGCNNQADPPNTSLTTDNSAGEPEMVLTNPDEYLSELCSNIIINGVEFSAPCTYEELSELFVLEPFGEKVKFEAEGFYVQSYDMFTKDNQYIGTVDFTYFYDGGSVIWCLEAIFDKTVYHYPDGHLDDVTTLTVGNIEVEKTTRSVIESNLGKGYDPDGDGDYITYDFEDGRLSVVYSEDTVANCRAWFNPLKTLS